MGIPNSVALAGIFMNKLEKDVIKPPLPIVYKQYVDDKLFNGFSMTITMKTLNLPRSF